MSGGFKITAQPSPIFSRMFAAASAGSKVRRITGLNLNITFFCNRELVIILQTKGCDTPTSRAISDCVISGLSFSRMRTCSLRLEGWGEDPKKIEAIIKDNAEVLAMYREEMVEKPGRPVGANSDNITIIQSEKRGTSRAYSIARVKKDCDPDTVAEVLAGKISPNAALVRSGIRVYRGRR